MHASLSTRGMLSDSPQRALGRNISPSLFSATFALPGLHVLLGLSSKVQEDRVLVLSVRVAEVGLLSKQPHESPLASQNPSSEQRRSLSLSSL